MTDSCIDGNGTTASGEVAGPAASDPNLSEPQQRPFDRTSAANPSNSIRGGGLDSQLASPKLLKLHMMLTHPTRGRKSNEASEGSRTKIPFRRSLGDPSQSQRPFDRNRFPSVRKRHGKREFCRSLSDISESMRLFDPTSVASGENHDADGNSDDRCDSTFLDECPPAACSLGSSNEDSDEAIVRGQPNARGPVARNPRGASEPRGRSRSPSGGLAEGPDAGLSSKPIAPSGSCRSSKSPDDATPSTKSETAASTDNNVAAKPYSVRYEIGQALLDDGHCVPFSSDSEASDLLTKLPLNSPLFVRRTSGEWTFATLAGRKTNRHGKQSLLVDFVRGGGWKKKVLKKHLWGEYLRLVDEEIVCWDPPSSAAASIASSRPAESISVPTKTVSVPVKTDAASVASQGGICRRLEAKIRLYKIKNLNLSGQCRDLSERLAEVESRLQAAHTRASGAESPCKIATEMDGRLEALKALAKTVKALKGENQTVVRERDLLRSRLDETEQAMVSLEAQMASEDARGVLSAVKGARRARAEEAEGPSREAAKSAEVEELESDKQSLRDCLDVVVQKMRSLQNDLDVALDSKQKAEAARDRATAEVEACKSAEGTAVQEAEELRTLIDKLRKAGEAAAADAKSREAGMKKELEYMQKNIERKEREFDVVKSLLDEKDQMIDSLEEELIDAKKELVSYNEQIEGENEAKALQRVTDRDYFNENELLGTSSLSLVLGKSGWDSTFSLATGKSFGASEQTFSLASGKSGFSLASGNSGRGIQPLGMGLLQRKRSDRMEEKDARIAQLEKSLSDNALQISNLRNELVAATVRFKDDESQRRMLIDSLEDENEVKSIKLEVLEAKFKEGGSWQEVSFLTEEDDTHSEDSEGTTQTWVSSVNGATPLKGEGKKRMNVRTQFASLQTQFSEIMSKKSPQVQKMEEEQEEERREMEKKREEEILRLRTQNEQLQMVTRGMLQSFDTDRQVEIDDLKKRLAAREATIKKLEMEMSQSKKSLMRKGGGILRKKRKEGTLHSSIDFNDSFEV